jgi:hypothetical protein
MNFTQTFSIPLLTGLASGIAVVSTLTAPAAIAQMSIGGGGTCTPHPISYEQYIPGHSENGIWIPGQYVTLSRMSTECNNNTPQPPITTNLGGRWYTDANNSGATTFISQNGFNRYTLTNEIGSRVTGYVEGNQIQAPQWNVTGILLNNGNQISWSNGTHWFRYSDQSENNPSINIPLGNSGAGINIKF